MPITLTDNLQALADAVGDEVKKLRVITNGNVDGLSALTTADKSNLVAAVNELKGILDEVTNIDDALVGLRTTWSSQKTKNEITAAVEGILGGAVESLDSLFEIAEKLGDFNATMEEFMLAIGDPETDFVAIFNEGLL